ncbi:lysophospholipid acyltransferase family protein [Rhodospirillaceae bacterium SYSU D60014]|uniref:lysophospholipid acyltransferase family protein n=1 Tax=Virgifigura deserti TaxID=2268457 RepID=UPI000E6742FE
MRPLKRLLGSDAGQAVLAWIAALYIRLVFRTTRWQWQGFEAVDALIRAKRPFVVCFWHNRLLLMPCAQRPPMRYHMLISGHRDGRLIARTIGHFGSGVVAGSSSRGGATALKRCVGLLDAGDSVGITPDGPRGPRMRAAAGAVEIARLGGAPMLPVTYSVARRHVLKSWDRFLLPHPFNRGLFIVGAPIEVPAQADAEQVEATRLELERRLNAISAEADRLTGHAPIEPAEPAANRKDRFRNAKRRLGAGGR